MSVSLYYGFHHGNISGRTSQEPALSLGGIFSALEHIKEPREARNFDPIETVEETLRQDAGHAHDEGRLKAHR
jgi:hypothetical protein